MSMWARRKMTKSQNAEGHETLGVGDVQREDSFHQPRTAVIVLVFQQVRHPRVPHHEGLYQELEVPRHQEVPAAAGQDVEGSDLLRDVEELPGVGLEEGEELGAGPRLLGTVAGVVETGGEVGMDLHLTQQDGVVGRSDLPLGQLGEKAPAGCNSIIGEERRRQQLLVERGNSS